MYQRRGGMLVLIVFAIAACVFLYYSFKTNREAGVTLSDTSLVMELGGQRSGGETERKDVHQEIMVDVSGAVKAPGVYKLPAGSRVIDAVQAAGGITEEADVEQINLAAYVEDEDKIVVPRESGDESAVTGKININTAPACMLETLPGIGPSKAQAIIQHRIENGPFQSIKDIMDVPGIGEATFSLIQDRIRTF